MEPNGNRIECKGELENPREPVEMEPNGNRTECEGEIENPQLLRQVSDPARGCQINDDQKGLLKDHIENEAIPIQVLTESNANIVAGQWGSSGGYRSAPEISE